MTMCGPSGPVGAPAGIPPLPCNPQGVAPAAGAPLLPQPTGYSEDALAALQQLFAQTNRQDSVSAKQDLESRSAEKRAHRREEDAALARARAAQEEQKGFFDSIGLVGLIGILRASPIVLVADVCMHMARMTPDFLKDFEKDNKAAIETATKLCCVMTPETLGGAAALGGLLLQETELLGKEASDWAGAALLVVGSAGTAAIVLSDKDSAIADEIRSVERDTQEYTKWAAVAGMALAAAGTLVGSFGSAAFVSTVMVVGIGVALSAGGFAVAETRCLDPLLGEDASLWIGSGMMLGGAVVGGLGAAALAGQATQAGSTTARALSVGGEVVSGAAKARQGLETVEDAAVARDVDEAHRDAKSHFFQAQRLQRIVEDIIDTVRDLKDSYRRVSQAVNQAVETQCQTQLMAAGMRG